MSRASANLRMVEKWGSTLFVSILTSVLWEIPAALASCAWVINLLRLAVFTLAPNFTVKIIGGGYLHMNSCLSSVCLLAYILPDNFLYNACILHVFFL